MKQKPQATLGYIRIKPLGTFSFKHPPYQKKGVGDWIDFFRIINFIFRFRAKKQ